MTVPLRGGRPCLVTNPHVTGKIVSIMGNGGSQADAARAVGVSASTVSRVARANAQTIEQMRDEIQRRVARKVLHGVDKATRARLRDAQDPKSRTGAHSYRALMDAAGVTGRGVNVDVAVGAMAVAHDPRRDVVFTEEDRKRHDELKRRLGF